MLISELYGKHKKETIYVVGTGTSLGLFPIDFLSDKITIGLNQSYKILETTYNLTIHPELIVKSARRKWITKRKRLNKTWPDYSCYWFLNNKNVHDYSYLKSKDDTLYVGRGIHTTAVSLAYKMGAKFIILIGCDMNTLAGHHHANPQDIQLHGLSEKEVYREYFLNLAEIQKKLTNTSIFSMSPFFGIGYENEHFILLGKTPRNIKPIDISEYQRDKVDFS